MARRFSQRYGHVKVDDAIQLDSISEEARIGIWNCLYIAFFNNGNYLDKSRGVARNIWVYYFNKPADKIPAYSDDYGYQGSLLEIIKSWIADSDWHKVYDLLEYMLDVTGDIRHFKLDVYLNSVFKKFNLGYTIINGFVTPITSEEEVKSIQDAIDNSPQSSSLHFVRALELMTDREQADYRNSIKESISAIESICKRIAGDDKSTLGDCLKVVENQSHIHPAMKRAFMQLYGYTSDQGGIRHALSEDSVTPTLEDARFMLITCSAFNNYLLAKIGS
ncbi:AbiJ-NTD4 domain-containing protein [Pantoea agglomerans]|uniref:AbiJ-NTD4 domain-containing protein n=1 Tax=Enterobacter agglomerans TaxID=549 RepID=UPI00045C97F7|nr:hypothetical protein [Pantoea agglomerans]KDA94770.1 hypothetical protein T296_09485 [Pantoea agglomerans Eh318]